MSDRELRVALEVACVAIIALGVGLVFWPAGIAVFGVLILLGLNGVGGGHR